MNFQQKTLFRATVPVKLLSLWLLCSSCAGPATPFGAHLSVLPEFKSRIPTSSSGAKLSSHPASQLYHSPFDLVLEIKDEKAIKPNFRYEILYNGKKVERWFKAEKIIISDRNPKSAKIIFENFSLIPGRQNKITFLYYPNSESAPVAYTFGPPSCPFKSAAEGNGSISHLKPFNPDISTASIEEIAVRGEINPPLLAALVAQESGFNPFAISWAKAVGLTQVTSLANKEILQARPDWEYDPSVEKKSFLELKTGILTGLVNEKNDWRLNRKKSLEGGAIYLNILKNYWEREAAVGVLKRLDHPISKTDILLASYNSGAYRVKKAIVKNRGSWLESPELGEARKYVMNIKSYCHSFTNNKNTTAISEAL